MFIRWKRRKKTSTKFWRGSRKLSEVADSLYCVIVESQRINGVPRQKVICYLGSLDEGDLGKLWLRVDFWDHIGPKLDPLGLTLRERARIEESIELVVPRVPHEEAAAFRKERQAFREKRAQLFRMFDVMRWLRS
jgi:hypothetical protein